MTTISRHLLAPLLLVLSSAAFAQDPFQTHVRPTQWLTAEQERETFTLPAGFEIQLFASEPEIQKPMNMAFDAKGRLWLTDTREYPYPVAEGEAGRDTLKILEDTDGDGRADKITTFAEGLNIPIGVYPYRDGAIVWSIPNIWFFRDTDGDGRADSREKLYGPFGWQRDTHGMNNGFTRGFDGWLYVCHGFNNESKVQGADGNEVSMQSGNTYRIKLDGSRIEHFTRGQVNPFGMTITEYGDLITADCHSKPLYLLMRDGYYPSFGKPHDGLGFVPPIMTHTHGSTALCGPCYYAGENFPAEYRGNVFVGNVMTSRVNRNAFQWHGSTPKAIEKPDLVSTDDPWFRPVDIQMGPDGAVYVADFYNRVIGHYEVPLDHPGRDRTTGRIWRIVYKGNAPESKPAQRPIDLTTASIEQRLGALDSGNLTYRLLALNYLSDHGTPAEIAALQEHLRQGRFATAGGRAAAVSILERAGRNGEDLSNDLLALDLDPELIGRLVQIVAERESLEGETHEWLFDVLSDMHYRGPVHRSVGDALARHPTLKGVDALLKAVQNCPADDELLRHQLRLALRNHLRLEGALEQLDIASLDAELAALTADAALGTDSVAAGNFLVAYLAKYDVPDSAKAAGYARHAARFAADVDFDHLAQTLPERLKDHPQRQLDLLVGIGEGLTQCGCRPSPALSQWCSDLVRQVLQADFSAVGWSAESLPGKPHRPDMFVTESRTSSDGDSQSLFFGSLPRGEQLCGIYRSAPFELPAKLSFFMAGHDGFPTAKQRTGNAIRLLDATTGAPLREAPPPRNDTAQQVVWDLTDIAGRQGLLEIVDADAANAYAWLAVGRFSLEGLNPSGVSQQLQIASQLIVGWGLPEFEHLLAEQLRSGGHDPATTSALAVALLDTFGHDPRLNAVASLLEEPLPQSLRDQIVAAAIARKAETTSAALAAAMQASPAAAQQKLAEQLASSPLGAAALIELASAGKASPRLLLRPTVKLKLAQIESIDLQQRTEQLTASLPPANAAIEARIRTVQEQFASADRSLENGHIAFKKHCAVCHKIGEEGEMIGPQLDGIGNRGLERVLEDLLDPHRNVDIQFRTTTLIMADGRVLSGLATTPEGDRFNLIDSQGKKISIAVAEVEDRQVSPLSLMPDNMVDKLSPEELHDLMAFLLSQTGKK